MIPHLLPASMPFYAIVSHRSHWFGLKVVRYEGFTVCDVFDEIPMSPLEWNRFLHQFVMLFDSQMSQTTVQFTPTVAPPGMCGFAALWCILRDCQIMGTPNIESTILRVQHHPQGNTIVEICNQAMYIWDQVCADQDFVGFANVVRVQFLDHLIRTQHVLPFCTAGVRRPRDRARHVPEREQRRVLPT